MKKTLVTPSGTQLHLNRRESQEWLVLETLDGTPVARQAKSSAGRVFRPASMMMGSPDSKGRDTFPLEYMVNDSWRSYDYQARKGEIMSPTFLNYWTGRC